jgi:hypothetical protein
MWSTKSQDGVQTSRLTLLGNPEQYSGSFCLFPDLEMQSCNGIPKISTTRRGIIMKSHLDWILRNDKEK